MYSAVRSNGWAIQHASARLRGDHTIVAMAVLICGDVFRKWVPEHFKGDLYLVLRALRSSRGRALQDAAANLREDKKFVRDAIREHAKAYTHAPKRLRNDKDLVLEAVRKDARFFDKLEKKWKEDADVIAIAFPIVTLQAECHPLSSATPRNSRQFTGEYTLKCWFYNPDCPWYKPKRMGQEMAEFTIPTEAFRPGATSGPRSGIHWIPKPNVHLLLDKDARLLRKEVQQVTGEKRTRYKFLFDDGHLVGSDALDEFQVELLRTLQQTDRSAPATPETQEQQGRRLRPRPLVRPANFGDGTPLSADESTDESSSPQAKQSTCHPRKATQTTAPFASTLEVFELWN